MNNRFKNLQPPKENMFKKKSTSSKTNQTTNSRWNNLEYGNKQSNNSFKRNSFKKTELKQNSRWSTLNTSERRDNSFKHNKRGGRGGVFRGRKQSKSNGLFSKAAFVDGVPQIKGSTQKSFNIMDSIMIKPQKQKKQKKKNKSPKNFVEVEKPKKETEEEKLQNDLWKKQLLQQYAYESFSEEEEDSEE